MRGQEELLSYEKFDVNSISGRGQLGLGNPNLAAHRLMSVESGISHPYSFCANVASATTVYILVQWICKDVCANISSPNMHEIEEKFMKAWRLWGR